MPDLLEPTSQSTAQQPQKGPYRFTAQSALIAAQLSVASRRLKAEQKRNSPPPVTIPVQPKIELTQPDDFAQKRLMRVREQLIRIDALAADEDDPKRLKELADATTRLSEQERVLAGRPLPGSRRPAQDRTPRAAAGAWLAEPVDVPAQPNPTSAALETSAVPERPLGWEYDDPNATPAPPERLPGDVTP